MKTRNIYLLIIVFIITLTLVAVSSLVIHESGSREIKIVGSTTVQPVAEALAQAYMEKHPDVKITVQGGDSLVGIKSVQSEKANIGTASRNLTQEESEDLTQYQIGKDGIAVVVNPNNPVNSLTTDQLKGIYEGNLTNWKQVGGKDEPINVITREVGSGTRLAFEDTLFRGKIVQNNATVAISTQQVMQDVAVLPSAVGYLSTNALNPDLKILRINNVSLTEESVNNGEYTLQRPLLFLVKEPATGVVKDFIDFTLSPEGQSIVNKTEYKSV
ncbi:MAG: phosphate ABC transporter substrate-binding protein [Methanobacterium sp.]|nr:phosphate ABC transporter substrate-binding protein [Methanobacterium sp.]